MVQYYWNTSWKTKQEALVLSYPSRHDSNFKAALSTRQDKAGAFPYFTPCQTNPEWIFYYLKNKKHEERLFYLISRQTHPLRFYLNLVKTHKVHFKYQKAHISYVLQRYESCRCPSEWKNTRRQREWPTEEITKSYSRSVKARRLSWFLEPPPNQCSPDTKLTLL